MKTITLNPVVLEDADLDHVTGGDVDNRNASIVAGNLSNNIGNAAGSEVGSEQDFRNATISFG